MKGVTADKVTSDQPLIIWLQGGPGCGSATGLYKEIGPFEIQNDAKKGQGEFLITERTSSWNK